ncbi:MAG TPA: DUF1254 domain-containing protein [Caulobacteraceae bacterium]|nr:DUF1254 domain-containing protein [Caulobacteraceae bacterium]
MDRRQLLASGWAWAALAGIARAQGVQATGEVADLRTAAREGWIYCLPLIEAAAARSRIAGPSSSGAEGGSNRFVHMSDLAGPQSRTITTPNNDTLYSHAWLDLSAGPVSITLPRTGERYFSLALMDMFTNNFLVIGPRTTHGEGGEITIAPPQGKAPAGSVRAPTTWVWALARTLVDGPSDLAAARAVQDGIVLRAHEGRIPDSGPGRDAAWNDYFLWAQALLDDNPPPEADRPFFQRIAALQLGPRHSFANARFADTETGDIEAGVNDGRALLAGLKPRGVQGWTYPKPDLGDFGQDYLYRAAVAVSGLAALPPSEAMYMRAVGPDGEGVLQEGHYRLSLPGPVPVDGFWSLTLYEATPQGQLFLTANPLGRYSIGDRTAGLKRGPNGELDIWIGRNDPGPSRRPNWLPAPASGPFALILRAYLPRAELVEGRYRLPELVRLDPPAAARPVAEPPVVKPPPPKPRRRRRR